MSPIVQLLGEPLAQKLGLTLVHFIWQGAALALVAVIALAGLRRATAAVRYAVLLALFGAMLCCPVATFMLTGGPPAAGLTATARPVPAAAAYVGSEPAPAGMLRYGEAPTRRVSASAAGPSDWRQRLGETWQWMRGRLMWVTALWLSGVLLLSARLLVGWGRLARSTRRGEAVSDARWREALTGLAARMKVSRPVRLLQCATAKAPVVLGWLRPVILVPPSAVAGLTPDQLEAVLAHELAHIRRGDYLVNLAQTMAETLLFYHPAVWWLSARIRMEREHCCDDIAVGASGDAVAYARALTTLEELHGTAARPALALGGPLVSRVRRLLGAGPSASDRSRPWLAGALAIATVAALILAGPISRAASSAGEVTVESDHGLQAAREALQSAREAATGERKGEGIAHCDRALALLAEAESSEEQRGLTLDALVLKAELSKLLLDYEAVLALWQQALGVAEELGDETRRARVLESIGLTYAQMDDKQKSTSHLRQAAEIFRQEGDLAGQGRCLNWLGGHAMSARDPAAARRYYEDALPLFAQAKSHEWAAVCRAALSLLEEVGDRRLPDLLAASWSCVELREGATAVEFGMEPGSGFSIAGLYPEALNVNSVFHQVSHLKKFLDASVPVEGSWSGESFSYTRQPLSSTVAVRSASARVTVPAGAFEHCLLTEQNTEEGEAAGAGTEDRRRLNRNYRVGTRRAWYAPGVGLVQLEVARGDGTKALIQLQEYTVEGNADAYLPLAIDNTWTYGWAGVDQRFVAKERYRVATQAGDLWYLERCSYLYDESGEMKPE